MIDECLVLTRSLADERDVALQDRSTGADLPTVRADYTRFKQVLLNLLSNAVKYNRRDGAVTLTCRRTPDGMLRFAVADTGIGIPRDKRGDLFRPFKRLGAETTEIEGTGIGLTITKKLMESMGGRIDFDSVPGEGSTFRVDLPLAEVPADRTDRPRGAAKEHAGPTV